MAAKVLHQAIVDTIARDIVDGRLAAGSVILLTDIQRDYGVSRTVAREAMRSLEAAQLVEARRRVGLVVCEYRQWDLLSPRVIGWRLQGERRAEQLESLTLLRLAVEPVAAGAAARRATAAQSAKLVGLATELGRLGALGDLEGFLATDIGYHSLLLEASGSELFGALRVTLAATLSGLMQAGVMPRYPRQDVLAAHLRVAEAVSRQDSEAAHAEMAELMRGTRSALYDRIPSTCR